MRDWVRYVREHLQLPDLRIHREEKIVRDLASQLEEFYHEAISRGASATEADSYAREQITDWEELRAGLRRVERSNTRPRLGRWFNTIEEEFRRRGRGWVIVADLGLDLNFALRTLRKNPAFLLVTVLILGLGIGATTAIFSVLKTVILQPLPYPEANRLMTVWNPQIGYNFNPFSTPNYIDCQDRSSSFEAWGAYTERFVNLAGRETAERVVSVWCTNGVLEALGVQPAQGRFFTEEEAGSEAAHVVLISDGLWRRHYGGDPDLVGREVLINGEHYTVLGIMPAGFEFPSLFYNRSKELWLPLALTSDESERDSHWLWTIGRLKQDVSLEQARTDFETIAASLAVEYPDANALRTVRIIPLTFMLKGIISGGLWVLMGAVGLVLLIACANVASLLMARGANRQVEVAVRASMGAGRFRLIRQLLTESLVLAAAGGVAGVVLAWWGVSILRGAIPASAPRFAALQVDGWVLLFSAALTLLTGVIFGLIPALSTSRFDLFQPLHEGGRGRTPGRKQTRFLGTLVVVQFALALVLANGALLMYRSLSNVTRSPELEQPERLLTAGLSLSGAAYEEPGRRYAVWVRLLDRLENLPGVESVAACSQRPFNYGSSGSILAEGEEYDPVVDRPLIAFTWATGSYFNAVGVPLLYGRSLIERDAGQENMSVVVNRALAEQYFPDQNAVGKRLRSNSVPPWFEATVVGVVDNFRQWGLEGGVYPEIFFPFGLHTYDEQWLVLRAATDPLSLIPAIRQELAEIDRNIPLSGIQTGEQLYAGSSAGRRLSTVLFGLFALLALILLAVGIYGVMSFQVAHRTHEIGVRMALGAERNGVMRMVLSRGMRLAALGIAIGLVGALITSGITGSMLYRVSPLSPLSILATGLMLALVGLFSSALPALRATRVDPIRAMQAE